MLLDTTIGSIKVEDAGQFIVKRASNQTFYVRMNNGKRPLTKRRRLTSRLVQSNVPLYLTTQTRFDDAT